MMAIFGVDHLWWDTRKWTNPFILKMQAVCSSYMLEEPKLNTQL